jgi:curved DNA-binding protein CbpA
MQSEVTQLLDLLEFTSQNRDNVDFDTVKAQYRMLAKKYHPDTSSTPSTTAFIKITKAYDRLVILDQQCSQRLFLT